jgi:hypothetical protein
LTLLVSPVGSFAAHAQNGGRNPTLAIRAHSLSPQSIVAVTVRLEHSLCVPITIPPIILIIIIVVTRHDTIAASDSSTTDPNSAHSDRELAAALSEQYRAERQRQNAQTDVLRAQRDWLASGLERLLTRMRRCAVCFYYICLRFGIRDFGVLGMRMPWKAIGEMTCIQKPDSRYNYP